MTYDTLFPYSLHQAYQCCARAFKQALECCGSGTATCQGIWDIHATSVSIFTICATTATTCCHPGTEDTFHGQVSTQHRCGTTTTCNPSKNVFRRSRSTCGHRLSTGERIAWVNNNSEREHANWNTVLIAYCTKSCHKPINCGYPKNHDGLSTQ